MREYLFGTTISFYLFGYEVTELCSCGGKVVRISDEDYGDADDATLLFLQACPVCNEQYCKWYDYVAKKFYVR